MKIIHTLLLLSILPSIALGQINPNPNEIHFRVLAWQVAISDLFLSQVAPPLPDPQHPDQSLPPDPSFVEKPIFIPFKFRSAFALCDKTKPLYFFRHVGALYKIAATVDLSNSADLPLIFFQGCKDSTNLSASVIPDDTSSLPIGAVRLVNFSSVPVTSYFDETPVPVAPNMNKVFLPPAPKPGKVVNFQLVRDSDGKCQYSNPWLGSTTNRTILFITDDKSRPQSVTFVHLVEPMKATVPEGDLQEYK